MKINRILSCLVIAFSLFASDISFAQTTVTIGAGTSSSSSRGPFQRSDSTSSSVYSRSNQVYTQAELNAVGILGGEEISQVNWWNHSGSNIIDATGDAILTIYMRNTSNADATVDSTWASATTGSTLVGTYTFNTSNNFPGVNDWQAFILDSPFIYAGGSLEIAVEWDCSGLTSIHPSQPNRLFTGNGALKFRYESTSNVSIAVRAGSSSPPSDWETSSHFKSERANIQLTYNLAGCPEPTGLSVSNVGTTTADISWDSSTSGALYDWIVVASGDGAAGTPIASGISSLTSTMVTGLSEFTSYDLHVKANCGGGNESAFSPAEPFFTLSSNTGSVQVGSGTSSSSSRGPIQRSDINSSTVYTRWHFVYTEADLVAAGLECGASLTGLNWEKGNSNIIDQPGDATWKVYIKNSTATAASADSWTNLINGSDMVVDRVFNVANNFPASSGWMPFNFNEPFVYNGGALEISVDWDGSGIATPGVSTGFNGNGAVTWRWESTAPNLHTVFRRSSSSAPSTISDVDDERANIQFVFNIDGAIDGNTDCPSACSLPTGLDATATSTTSADLSWVSSANAMSYDWKVVAEGAGYSAAAIASGNAAGTSASVSGLSEFTGYDFYVDADCGGSTSGPEGPFTFWTLPSATIDYTIGTGSSSSSTRGPFQRSDLSSSTVFSRFNHVYTAAELASAGIVNGDAITALNWELASSNIMIGAGDATLKVYVKNSSATAAAADTWTNLITGSDLLVDEVYNTSNNFPGANGWMPFTFDSPFFYTGGAIEIAVDWDCSQVSTPAFSGDGSLKWRWESVAPDNLVVKKTSSSSASSTIDDLKDERANIQFVVAASCTASFSLDDVTCDANTAGADTYTAQFTYDASMETQDLTISLSSTPVSQSATSITAGTSGTFTVTMSEATASYVVTLSNAACSIDESVTGISCPFIPTNDDCANAQAIAVAEFGGPVGYVNGTSENAGLDLGARCGTDASGVWYSFVAESANDIIQAGVHPALTPGFPTGYDAIISVWDGCAGTCLGTYDNYGPDQLERVVVGGLTPGNTYLYFVEEAGAASAPEFSTTVKSFADATLRAPWCGATDLDLGSVIQSERDDVNEIYTFVGVQVPAYGFEFAQGSSVIGTVNNMAVDGHYQQLGGVGGLAYGQTYEVRVRHQVRLNANGMMANYWSEYGTPCSISLGAAPTTQLDASFCNGMTNYYLSQNVLATPLVGATSYRFTFDDGSGTTIVYESDNYSVQLYQVPGITYASTYSITVEAYINGAWTAPGSSCTVVMNAKPENASLLATSCNGTFNFPSSEVLLADNILGAEYYEFRFYDGASYITAINPDLSLTLEPSLALSAGVTYTVDVRVFAGGAWGDFSSVCPITLQPAPTIGDGGTNGITMKDLSTDASLSMYPNPNDGQHVMIHLDKIDDEAQLISFVISDISGKVIYSEAFGNKGTSVNRTIRFDAPLSPGMYFVTVDVNDIRKTEKLIVE